MKTDKPFSVSLLIFWKDLYYYPNPSSFQKIMTQEAIVHSVNTKMTEKKTNKRKPMVRVYIIRWNLYCHFKGCKIHVTYEELKKARILVFFKKKVYFSLVCPRNTCNDGSCYLNKVITFLAIRAVKCKTRGVYLLQATTGLEFLAFFKVLGLRQDSTLYAPNLS